MTAAFITPHSDPDIVSMLRRDIPINLMTRALIAAILIAYQVLALTCPIFCLGALQHEAAVATEPGSASAHEHHLHGHDADAPDTSAASLSAVHDGCEDCATPPDAMWFRTPKFAETTPSTVLAYVTIQPDCVDLVSHRAADQPLHGLFPDTSPPARALSPLRV